MRESAVLALVLLFGVPAAPGKLPDDWKLVKDAKGLCQIMVPADWVPLDSGGAAVFRDASTAIAVVTSQPGQEFKPLNAALLKAFAIPKEKMFENSASRIFYQEKTSRRPEDTSAFTASVPAPKGTCSSHVVVLPSIPEDVARKIVTSISPVEPKE